MKKIFIVIIFISGCYTPKKAERSANKIAISYPEILAKKARDLFPCVTSKGDTLYVSDSAAYKEALQAAQDDAFKLFQSNDSLQKLADSLHADSSCYKIIDVYAQMIKNISKDRDTWQYKAQHIPPIIVTRSIHDTTVDNAAVKACEVDKNTAISNLATQNKRADKFEGRSKKYFWIMLALGAILGIIGYAKIKSSFKPKTA